MEVVAETWKRRNKREQMRVLGKDTSEADIADQERREQAVKWEILDQKEWMERRWSIECFKDM